MSFVDSDTLRVVIRHTKSEMLDLGTATVFRNYAGRRLWFTGAVLLLLAVSIYFSQSTRAARGMEWRIVLIVGISVIVLLFRLVLLRIRTKPPEVDTTVIVTPQSVTVEIPDKATTTMPIGRVTLVKRPGAYDLNDKQTTLIRIPTRVLASGEAEHLEALFRTASPAS